MSDSEIQYIQPELHAAASQLRSAQGVFSIKYDSILAKSTEVMDAIGYRAESNFPYSNDETIHFPDGRLYVTGNPSMAYEDLYNKAVLTLYGMINVLKATAFNLDLAATQMRQADQVAGPPVPGGNQP